MSEIPAISKPKLSFPIVVFVFALFAHFVMALRFEVNWDEFFRLGWIYEFKSQTLSHVLETSYIHGFRWLEYVSENEVNQIVAGRLVMFACLIVTCISLFKISKRLTGRDAALISVLAFLFFSFVFRHATAFRVDPPVIALLMSALCVLTVSELKVRYFFIVGALIGIAGVISMKSIFYVPTLGVLLLIYWYDSKWSRSAFLNCLIATATALAVWCVLFLVHKNSLPESDTVLGFVKYASNSSLSEYGLFPRLGVLKQAVLRNPLYIYLFVFGVVLTIRDLNGKSFGSKPFKILAFTLPLIAVVVYAHSYVYFYTFLLAPLSVVIGVAAREIKMQMPRIFGMLPAILLLFAIPTIYSSFGQTNHYQKQVNNVVHELFPEPVAYIDRCSQISSFPKTGLFMTMMQMDEYYFAGVDKVSSDIKKFQPKFVLANIESLVPDRSLEIPVDRQLRPTDQSMLTDNFIHHWGNIFVAGKTLKANSKPERFQIYIAGPYTVEAESSVKINDELYNSGEVVNLESGEHSYLISGSGSAKLRWGNGLKKPSQKPLGNILFRGF